MEASRMLLKMQMLTQVYIQSIVQMQTAKHLYLL